MRGLLAALLVSVGVNIALVAFMAGRVAGGAPPFGPNGADRPGAAHRFLDRASPETQALMRDAFAARWNDIRPLRDDAGRARKALRDAILAEPFDKARVEAAYAAFQVADTGLRGAHARVVIDVMEKLPLEERRILVDALAEQRGARGFGPRGRPPRP